MKKKFIEKRNRQMVIDEQADVFMHNLKWLRHDYDISKEFMIQILNISISELNQIEDGNFPPHLCFDVFLNACDFFGVSPRDMLTKRFGE